MGGELLTSPKGGEQSPPIKYYEVFHEHEPYYLFLGMSSDEYWNEDSTRVKKYRKMYEYKREERNHEMWLQGLYIYEALLDVSPMFHDFIKKPKPLPYPDKPYALSREEHEEREKSKEQTKMEGFLAKTKAWAKRVNDKKKKEETING